MNRLERLHAITNHLRARSPRTVSASALADRFGVSRRTIERDVRSLNEAGVPIYGIDGRGGGYGILPEHSMPALRLTTLEAAACVAALSLIDDSPMAAHARTALDKLRTALPDPMAAIDEWDSSIRTIESPQLLNCAVWLGAIRDQVLVELTYAHDAGPRLVEPYTTLQGGGSWYLVGWCLSRSAVRGFRTDRLRTLSATRTPFVPIHRDAVAEDLSRWETRPLT